MEEQRPLAEQSSIRRLPRYGSWRQCRRAAVFRRARRSCRNAAISPVNLGAASNVIVVSACEQCSDGDAMMWKDAFWSGTTGPCGSTRHERAGAGRPREGCTGRRHIAINSHCRGGCRRNAELPSRPLCRRRAFSNLHKIKQRLLYTSRPIFYEDDDLQRLAAGVVDPRTALLNPR